MSRLRTLLADDHTLVRAGLRKLLESIPDVEVVGEASDGLMLLQLALQLQPQLVLMDIAMPGLNGLETTARLMGMSCSPSRRRPSTSLRRASGRMKSSDAAMCAARRCWYAESLKK